MSNPAQEDVGCWWLYRPDWGWQPVIVAYGSFIQPGDSFRHPVTPGMIWGERITPFEVTPEEIEPYLRGPVTLSPEDQKALDKMTPKLLAKIKAQNKSHESKA